MICIRVLSSHLENNIVNSATSVYILLMFYSIVNRCVPPVSQKKKKQVRYVQFIFLIRFEKSALCCIHLPLTYSYSHGGNKGSAIVEFPGPR